MAIITPPAALPIRRIQWRLRQAHQVNRSGWTGRRQVLTTPGAALWSASAEFVPIRGEAGAKKWRAFFHQLEGQLNKFPLIAVENAQHGGANPTIVSGAQGATSLQLSASPPALAAGDFMTVKLADDSFQMVVLVAAISGTTAQFLPGLRDDAATGAGSVETIWPYAHVAMTEDSFEHSVDQGQIYSFAFDVEEAF